MLDPVHQAARIRRSIARMVTDYQNDGRYMDLNGGWHTNTNGILSAWAELDTLGLGYE